MRLRVMNGTPQHGVSLCDSCSNVMKRKGTRLSDVWYACDTWPGPIVQPVVECNQYARAGMNAPFEATKMAYRWVPSLGKFISPWEHEQMRVTNKLKQGDY